jgi:23S rRNA (pseudouridine1915-N3)-methyltransferase
MTVLCVGKLKEPHWKDAQAEFVKRLSTLTKLGIIEVTPEATGATVSPAKAKAAEGKRLLERIERADATIVAMDEHGKQMTSTAFAELVRSVGEQGREVLFVIGGTEGLDASVLDRADRTVALSAMTFTHEMARVFLLEQIYRAEHILKGGPYHR